MVRLRFQRKGRTHRPFYRLAAVDSRFKGNGKFIELLGWFNPVAPDDSKRYELDRERIQHWLSVGAQPSDTVADLLGKEDLLTPKLKASWEARREASRNRVMAKVSVENADKALEALAALAGDAEADVSSFQESAAGAAREAKKFASNGKPTEAAAQAEIAEKALAEAQAADEAAKKAKAEQEAKEAAEAEAKAKAEAEAEGAAAAEGESSES